MLILKFFAVGSQKTESRIQNFMPGSESGARVRYIQAISVISGPVLYKDPGDFQDSVHAASGTIRSKNTRNARTSGF
jgi:hypothetical protein